MAITKASDLAKLLADGVVGTTEIGDGQITTAKIADSAITTDKLASNAVTAAQLSVSGDDIPYDNSVSGMSANTLQEAIDYLNVVTGGGSAGAQATYTRDAFTATEGQTVFTTSNGYTLGYVQVFMNGVLLALTDYVANNETTVVLNVGASAGDEIVIVAYDSFAISEVLRVLNISASAPDDALTIDADGGIQIPSGFTAAGASFSNEITAPRLVLQNNSVDGGEIQFESTGQTSWFMDNSSGYLRGFQPGIEHFSFSPTGEFRPNRGILLGGTSASNLLDDYEEGTWTPIPRDSSGNSLGVGRGTYRKVGNLVYISITTHANEMSGAVKYWDGLPFAIATEREGSLGWTTREDGIPAVTPTDVHPYVSNSTRIRYLVGTNPSATITYPSTAHYYRTGMSGCYETA